MTAMSNFKEGYQALSEGSPGATLSHLNAQLPVQK